MVLPGVRFNDCFFSEPMPLAGWAPPACAGLFVVLTRNPQWGPKPFQPLYFGEFGNDAKRTATLPSVAHADNLLVAHVPLPYSTATQRHALCKELILAHNPAGQNNGTIVSASELARKVDELEARQQEQNQQILSLLAHLGKLFSPQPVGPRRPIGFLADAAPAGATESGS